MSDAASAESRQLTITTQADAKSLVIRVAGEVDLATVAQLRTALHTSLDGPLSTAEVRVDLARTSFLDATGVGALVEGMEAARRAGVGFSIQNPTGVVRRVLDILGLSRSLQVEAARPAAPPTRPSGPRTQS